MFLTQRAVRLPVQGSIGLSIGIFPLRGEGDALGVVEILAPTAAIEGREDVLLALIGQSALVLSSAHVRTEAERALAGVSALLRLASELLWARTATEVVRLSVNACHEHLGTPAAGLLPDRDGWGWFLAASEGLGVRRRSELRAGLRSSSEETATRRLRLPSLRSRFREVSGCREVVGVRASSAVLLLGDAPHGHAEFLEGVTSLLTEVLPRLGIDGVRPTRRPWNELGIAWTAHELKGPLVGARAALDRVAMTSTRSEGRELLRRTREELRQLSELIDPLLRWSTGSEMLERQRLDLVQVVREAVASFDLRFDVGRIFIDAPEHLIVLADRPQLRSAIGNVVRNALMYSPAGTPVRVLIERENRLVRVVVRDRGPGVPAEDRAVVFDPFSRGRNGVTVTRPGSGLGLFIARRVLEAHGGAISLRPGRVGATFVLELPSLPEGRERCAS